ncbi:hypothetical protein HMPREF3034_01421 [Prevotella sp. DNF00663]|nr:hypothetical protein HMPREF3034_01421 [Prevotella sp. DNF00663]
MYISDNIITFAENKRNMTGLNLQSIIIDIRLKRAEGSDEVSW